MARDSERDAELTTEVRRRDGDAGVIALSTDGALGAKGRLLKCGADACVDFPCEAPTVEMWIRATARRLLRDWSLMSEGFQLDPGEGELRLGAKTVRFRRMEYRVCEYLVMNFSCPTPPRTRAAEHWRFRTRICESARRGLGWQGARICCHVRTRTATH